MNNKNVLHIGKIYQVLFHIWEYTWKKKYHIKCTHVFQYCAYVCYIDTLVILYINIINHYIISTDVNICYIIFHFIMANVWIF